LHSEARAGRSETPGDRVDLGVGFRVAQLVLKGTGEVNRDVDRVGQAEQSPERILPVEKFEVCPNGHRHREDGLGIGLRLTMGVVGHQSGREGDDQWWVGELYDRIGTREAQLREALESAPACGWSV
jgi:hypothetical protein